MLLHSALPTIQGAQRECQVYTQPADYVGLLGFASVRTVRLRNDVQRLRHLPRHPALLRTAAARAGAECGVHCVLLPLLQLRAALVAQAEAAQRQRLQAGGAAGDRRVRPQQEDERGGCQTDFPTADRAGEHHAELHSRDPASAIIAGEQQGGEGIIVGPAVPVAEQG